MRAVAAQVNASTGVVTHCFAGERELTAYALEARSRTANRIWISSWDAALADATHAAERAERYRVSRDTLRALLEAALDQDGSGGAGRVDDVAPRAEVLHAAVLGLAFQAVLDPAAHPAERQVALVDELLARVTAG